jgi:ADP-ribose pyrophosphatase YjhB (NUDIX family)
LPYLIFWDILELVYHVYAVAGQHSHLTGGIAMIEATSCGGVVIFRGKILLLYKNFKNKYEGWVLPKGTVEAGEEYKDTALREVLEESGARASIIKYIGKSEYTFNVPEDTVDKEVHWYLMMADSYYSKPQREEYFVDSGFYKYHEAYHLLKFANEKQILEKAYHEYLELKKKNLWGNKKYF